jgi:ribosomal-protein-alanine N-acetyltransferase
VILEVRSGNKRAQRLYLNLGFEIFTTCKNYYPDGEGAIIMRRSL